jgi:bifunctional UDP-N-acetylglucosamine pyrophosphorylase / glucosamine-1-phosphate N-acetyltransferase
MPINSSSSLAIILAAGEGTRMKSSKPKVLHEVAGLSMLGHVLAAVKAAKIARIVVVIGPGREDVATQIKNHAPDAEIIVQTERLGTAHAVLHARVALEQKPKSVVVLFADTPLISSQTIQNMLEAVDSRNAVAALGFYTINPTGYGRLLMSGDKLNAIREHKDASDKEREVRFCNAGLMALSGDHALEILSEIGNENAQKEYYLPDAVEVARAQGLDCVALEADSNEVLGVNDRVQLSQAEAVYQTRLRDQHMRNGVTLHAPETVFFQHDTLIASDVTIEPHVVFGADVKIETGCTIKAFSHIDGATLAQSVSVGPFARLRLGTVLGENSKVGNFVEIKASNIGADAKISHLSYIGDAEIGADANIGAGTITCNYDGFNKFKTNIGAGAFIGSNSSLVAPVTIGAGAYVGSGSVITEDVPDNALGIARSKQVVKLGWSDVFRAKF